MIANNALSVNSNNNYSFENQANSKGVISTLSNNKNTNNHNNVFNNCTVPIELSENFFINRRKHNVKIQVKLRVDGIYLRRETDSNNQVNEQLIHIGDIVGSHCGQRIKKRARGGLSSCRRTTTDDDDGDQTSAAPAPSNSQSPTTINNNKSSPSSARKDTSAFLYIYAYVKTEEPLRRNRAVRILRFRSHSSYEQNLQTAERWHLAIRMNKQQQASNSPTVSAINSAEACANKPLLILLNPKSGSGKSRDMFLKQVAPILKEAQMQYDLHITTHVNHARNLVRDRHDLLERFGGIVIASGDGLFYEVLNGLMERPDWRLASQQLPLGIIPCGSGNGLARSIAYLYKEPYEPKPVLTATLACVSGRSALMDIVRVEVLSPLNKCNVMYSFLSVGWGLIADVDIESEVLRSFGSQRFTLWTVHRLINLRTYKGKLSYLPCPNEKKQQPQQQLSRSQPGSEQFRKTDEQEFYDLPDNPIGNGIESNDDDFADAISLDGLSIIPNNIDSFHSAVSRRTAYYSIAGQSIRSHRSFTSGLLSKRIEAANAELELSTNGSAKGITKSTTTNGNISSKLPPLNIALENGLDGWHCEEGQFVMVHAAYTTHLASDCFFAPQSELNDGIIYLVIIRSGVSRTQLLHFLLNMSSGTHLPTEPNQYIQVVPVQAFRIEPHGSDGIITVDGERINYGPVQAEIIPGMINVMVPDEK